MSDQRKTPTANSKQPATPPAKLAERRDRQAVALRENLAKRRRQSRGDIDAPPPCAPRPVTGAPATGRMATGKRDG